MKIFFWVAAAVVALAAIHFLALYAERRGWIYYLNSKPSPGGIGNAFLEVQSMLEPGKKHVLEIRNEETSEDAQTGDPPEPGPPGKRQPGP